MKIGGVAALFFVGCAVVIAAASKSSNDGKILSSCGEYIPGKFNFFGKRVFQYLCVAVFRQITIFILLF